MKRLKNKYQEIKKDIKKTYKKIKKEHLIREYFKNNILFVTFVITCVLNSTLLRFFCMHTWENYLSIKAIMADLTVVIIVGALGYLFKPKNRFTYYFIMEIIFTGICVANSIYYTFYTSFASVSMLSLTQYIGDVGDAVVENVFKPRDCIYLIGPIALIITYLKIKKRNYFKKVETKAVRKKKTAQTLTAGGIIGLLFILTMSSLDVSRFVKQWNKEYIVMRFGIYIYQVNDITSSLQPKINSMFGYDSAKREFEEYFEDKEKSPANEYTNIFKGKNVLVIHAESMMSVLIDMKFNGKEVTPNLNKIAHSGMYFNNFYSQVSVGTSSDTELTYNTSLMPTKSGTAFVSYSDRTYNAIPKEFNKLGYRTFSMHANNADFWNRRKMHKNLGYDRFYSKTDYEVTKETSVGLGLSDYNFFEQSIPKIKSVSQKYDNWYGLLIMLSNHTPFSEVDKYGDFEVNLKENVTDENGQPQEKVYRYMEDTKLGNYFKSAHYADGSLGEFIDGLDKEGLLDNTVVVIYGDHDSRLSKSEWRRYYNYDKETDKKLEKDDPNYKEFDYYQNELNRKVPFIIWTKDMKGTNLNQEISYVMGMYDVMPTLGNMFGFYNKYALGHDIFDIKDNNIVVFPNGNWVTKKEYYNEQKEEYYPLSDQVMSKDETSNNSEYANKLLDVSNNIIVFDLLSDEPKEME